MDKWVTSKCLTFKSRWRSARSRTADLTIRILHAKLVAGGLLGLELRTYLQSESYMLNSSLAVCSVSNCGLIYNQNLTC